VTPDDNAPRPRRSFSRITPAEERQAMIEELLARGVPFEALEHEPDLGGLAADVNIRGLERITPAGAAAEAGLDPDDARRVWISLGVAVGDDDAPAFTPDEVCILRFFADIRELFGEPAVLQAFRVMGSAFTRIAEAEVSTLRLAFEVPFVEGGASGVEVTEGYLRLQSMVLPELEATFASLHRLLLARSSRRAWAVDGEGAATLAEVAVGFADLAGFTTLSRQLSPGELADAVDAFEERVGELVTLHGGQVVKLIGDEVMFVADDCDDALTIARRLASDLPGDLDLPPVRVGMAAGTVVTRDGDYYGSVVNLAARLVGVAEPGEIVVSRTVADAAAGTAVTVALPPVEVKGFVEPVAAFRLT
jgi:adenylate cyclase